MKKTKLISRINTLFWWIIMGLAWFIGIFSNKVYNQNELWLIDYSKKYNEKFK